MSIRSRLKSAVKEIRTMVRAARATVREVFRSDPALPTDPPPPTSPRAPDPYEEDVRRTWTQDAARQRLAIDMGPPDDKRPTLDDIRDLLRSMMHADGRWKPDSIEKRIDYLAGNILEGKDRRGRPTGVRREEDEGWSFDDLDDGWFEAYFDGEGEST